MKIKGKETPKQGVTVVMSITHQSICSHKNSMTCEIAFEMLKTPDLTQVILTDVLNMPKKRTCLKNQYQTWFSTWQRHESHSCVCDEHITVYCLYGSKNLCRDDFK